MDDFGVKYIDKEHAMHLINVLKKCYNVEEDGEGKRYMGFTMDWDYINGEVHLSMPDYVKWALARFGHPILDKPQHQPHQHTIPTYGSTVQNTKPADTSTRLSLTEKSSSKK